MKPQEVLLCLCAMMFPCFAAQAEARFQVLHENQWHDVVTTKHDVPYIMIEGKKVSAFNDGMRLAQVGYNNDLMQRSPQWAYVDVLSSESGTNFTPEQGIRSTLNLTFKVEAVKPLIYFCLFANGKEVRQSMSKGSDHGFSRSANFCRSKSCVP